MKSLFTCLRKLVKPFFKGYKDEILDILLFGSVIRGKENPNDTDILLIFTDKVNMNIVSELQKLLSMKIKNISVIPVTKKIYKTPTFLAREGILFEGYSLINKNFIASDFGYSSFGLFITSTKKFTNVERTRYYYALNGRRSLKGELKVLNGIRLSNDLIAIPLKNIERARAFFEHWKLDYQYVPILIPIRLGRAEILGKVKVG